MNILILYYLSFLIFSGIFYGVLFEFSGEDFSLILTISTTVLILLLPVYYLTSISLPGILIIGLGGSLVISGTIMLPLFIFLGLPGIICIFLGAALSLPGGATYVFQSLISLIEFIFNEAEFAESIIKTIENFLQGFSTPGGIYYNYLLHTILGAFLYIFAAVGLSLAFFKKEAQDLPGGVDELLNKTGITRSKLDPTGKVRIKGEIWLARAQEPPIDANNEIIVIENEDKIPIVSLYDENDEK